MNDYVEHFWTKLLTYPFFLPRIVFSYSIFSGHGRYIVLKRHTSVFVITYVYDESYRSWNFNGNIFPEEIVSIDFFFLGLQFGVNLYLYFLLFKISGSLIEYNCRCFFLAFIGDSRERCSCNYRRWFWLFIRMSCSFTAIRNRTRMAGTTNQTNIFMLPTVMFKRIHYFIGRRTIPEMDVIYYTGSR